MAEIDPPPQVETPDPAPVITKKPALVTAIAAKVKRLFDRSPSKPSEVPESAVNTPATLSRDEAVDRMRAAAIGPLPTTPLPKPGLTEASPDETAA